MNSSISKVISSTIHTMVYHMRYSGAHVVHKENVAEHSYFVTLIADWLAEDLQQKHSLSLDRLAILHMAMYHDTEEAYTGDLITPVKNKSPELKKEWDKMCELMMTEGLTHDFPLQPHITNHILRIHKKYESEKYTGIENQIVKFSDGVQSIVYLLREVGFGNKHVFPILENMMKSICLRFSEHTLLGDYVTDLQNIVHDTIYEDNSLCLKPNAIQK